MVHHKKLVNGILNGRRLDIARAITHVENEQDGATQLLSTLYPHTGKAHIIGVTGAPGTGKSTLVTMLAKQYRELGLTVAILAIDPSSPFTGGALLGDRVRMRTLSGDQGIFIRSMATRGSLGGLSKTSSDVVTILDAAGFERIIVETVGVGQAEIDVASTAHTTLVIEAPGMGDEVQAIKAGILEIADILVVNKADRPGVDRTVRALQMVLALDSGVTQQVRHHGQLLSVESPASASESQESWNVQILKTVSTTGEGINELCRQIDCHSAWLTKSSERVMREKLRISKTIETIIQSELNRRIRASMPDGVLDTKIEEVRQRRMDPYQVARTLLDKLS
ncbi:methylmalonyl Co-A mutase-associated GTPase MeaB [Chloroflexi bacterium TSY]|nr:methylmalonyl Co-A mutase-associated GTPase MeaB [Chloroflexi bacterium TSY]